MDGRGGVREHYWTVSERGGRAHEVVYTREGGDRGEHWLQSAMALCLLYFVGRVLFSGLVTTLLVGLAAALFMHLLDGAAPSSKHYARPYYSHF